MSKFFISIFMMISLLGANIAHATGFDYKNHQCHSAKKTDNQLENKKQDTNKVAKLKHDCCLQISCLPNLYLVKDSLTSSNIVFVLGQDSIISALVLPQLEPPSRS